MTYTFSLSAVYKRGGVTFLPTVCLHPSLSCHSCLLLLTCQHLSFPFSFLQPLHCRTPISSILARFSWWNSGSICIDNLDSYCFRWPSQAGESNWESLAGRQHNIRSLSTLIGTHLCSYLIIQSCGSNTMHNHADAIKVK